ncbi:MAG: SpoIIIAH-like family protein [Clostridia bacterium]|nr:SpoIIIAH-like family protein [Clostridia bacterium]
MNFKKVNFKKIFKREREKSPKKNKMLILHKKQIAAVSLMLMIGVAGYLNWTFQNDAVDPDVAVMYNEAAKKIGEAQMVSADKTDSEEKSDESEKKEQTAKNTNNYFAQAKLDREVKRSEAMEMLTQLLENEGADKDAKKNAEDQIHKMADYTEKEVAIENMIRAKNFGENIVFMSEDLVSIALESNGLNEIDAAQILDIVISATDYSADKVKIVEISK